MTGATCGNAHSLEYLISLTGYIVPGKLSLKIDFAKKILKIRPLMSVLLTSHKVSPLFIPF